MTRLPVLLLYHEAKVVASCVAVNLSYLVTHVLRCGYYYSTISMLKRYLVTTFVSKASQLLLLLVFVNKKFPHSIESSRPKSFLHICHFCWNYKIAPREPTNSLNP